MNGVLQRRSRLTKPEEESDAEDPRTKKKNNHF